MVEMLIVMAIFVMVAGVCFSFYISNTSQFLLSQAYVEQQQNLRVAFYVMSRDLRMAGNGLNVLGPDVSIVQAYTGSQMTLSGGHVAVDTSPGWFKNTDTAELGFRAIFGFDGGNSAADSVTIFRAEMEYPAPLGVVKSTSLRTLELDTNIPDSTVVTGDIIVLVNGAQACLLETDDAEDDEISYVEGGRFTGPSGPPSGFPVVGSTVYNFKDVSLLTYYLDQTNNRLMVANHDNAHDIFDEPATKSSVVANNIDDLQLYYGLEAHPVDPGILSEDPDISTNTLKDDFVKAVALAMTSKASYGSGKSIYVRPELFNRAPGVVADNYRRGILSEYVYLRNHQK
ncbi:MAG: hypothetical protein LBF38_00505 [Deltaproteobacteria bacterium]|nr:hypothetical protein [Deltaproteobacteria bacterium]